MVKQKYDLDAVKLPVQKVEEPELQKRAAPQEPPAGTNAKNQYR